MGFYPYHAVSLLVVVTSLSLCTAEELQAQICEIKGECQLGVFAMAEQAQGLDVPMETEDSQQSHGMDTEAVNDETEDYPMSQDEGELDGGPPEQKDEAQAESDKQRANMQIEEQSQDTDERPTDTSGVGVGQEASGGPSAQGAETKESSVDKEDSSAAAETGQQGPGEEVKSKLPTAAEGDNKELDEEEEEEEPNFPNTLKGFGYHFKDGRLQNIETGEGFVFEVKKGNKAYNQKHYEALGEAITEEVYKLLETEGGLKRVNIPASAKGDCSFYYVSEDAQTADKLMILIHGSGVVRAGQWARSLIVNDCLDSGTQLPYIKRAKEEGYGVVVTNTNENTRWVKGKVKQYKESGTPEQHAKYVWDHCVKKAKAKHIDIVAHSYGGVVAVNLMDNFFRDFTRRVKKIAFTDSVHTYNPVRVRPARWDWLSTRAVNWVMSDAPLDTELPQWEDRVERRAAGTPKHVETSWFSFESVFKYFSEPDSEEQEEQK